VAIPSLFEKPYYPFIPLEPLHREQPLRKIEKSSGGVLLMVEFLKNHP
jgi:hypothetical protein